MRCRRDLYHGQRHSLRNISHGSKFTEPNALVCRVNPFAMGYGGQPSKVRTLSCAPTSLAGASPGGRPVCRTSLCRKPRFNPCRRFSCGMRRSRLRIDAPEASRSMIKISVILLAYRQEGFISAAMDSLLNQEMAPYEVIVVDDCSPDSTAGIIEQFIISKSRHWHFIRKELNEGVVAALRSALRVASGDVIIMAAGDDMSGPARVAKTADFFDGHPESYGLILGASVMDAAGRLTGRTVNYPSRLPARLSTASLSGHDLMPGLHACGASSAFRREVFDNFGPVRDDVYADDRVYALRAILLGGCVFLPDLMVSWRDHGANLSFISGRGRGPHLVKHFEGCAAVIEQHLQDLEFWEKSLGGQRPPENLKGFTTELKAERSRLRLLIACHQPGLDVVNVLRTAMIWLASDGRKSGRLAGLFKALAQMLIPYPLQRMLVAARKRND